MLYRPKLISITALCWWSPNVIDGCLLYQSCSQKRGRVMNMAQDNIVIVFKQRICTNMEPIRGDEIKIS